MSQPSYIPSLDGGGITGALAACTREVATHETWVI
jgi:hypothetical protein